MAKDKLSPIEQLIQEIVADLLNQHDSNPKIDQIIMTLGTLTTAIGLLGQAQASTDAKVQFIASQFPGGGDAPGATQDQLDALSKRVTDETGVIQQADAGFQPPQT